MKTVPPPTPGRKLYDEIAKAVSSLKVLERIALIAAIQRGNGYEGLPSAVKAALEGLTKKR